VRRRAGGQSEADQPDPSEHGRRAVLINDGGSAE
jgi:hypothetical protein